MSTFDTPIVVETPWPYRPTQAQLNDCELFGPAVLRDFATAVRKPSWSVHEAAALLLRLDPAIATAEWIEDNDSFESEVIPAYYAVGDAIEAAQARGALGPALWPTHVLSWAESEHIQVPDGLEAAVRRAELGAIGLENEIARLNEVIECLRRERDGGGIPAGKRKGTLYRIIHALAKQHYGYDRDASRNEAPKRIAQAVVDATDKEISVDTVRNVLADAHEWAAF